MMTQDKAGNTFFKNDLGEFHNDKGPAVVLINGTKSWYLNGKLHREDGPAMEHPDGHLVWFKDDFIHREDGPAIEYTDGTKEWFYHGKLHRETGPAIESVDGRKAFYLYGKLYSNRKEYNKAVIRLLLGTYSETKKQESLAEILDDKIAFAKKISTPGTIIYRNKIGLFHREDGPAIECLDGTKYWFVNGIGTIK